MLDLLHPSDIVLRMGKQKIKTEDDLGLNIEYDYSFGEHSPLGSTLLSVSDPRRILDQSSATIPNSQVVRELFHNAIMAVHSIPNNSSKKNVNTFAIKRHGVPKFAILDTGCGMSPEELPRFIGQLGSSKKTGTGRHGCGTKVICYRLSPLGLEYITWNGIDSPCRGRLFDNGQDVVFTKVETVEVEDLPTGIREAGHGTLVVLHGHDLQEDTFDAVLNWLGAKATKGLQQWINCHYSTLPEGIEFKLRTMRREGGDPLDSVYYDDRTGGNLGTIKVMEIAKTTSGVFRRKGYEVLWYFNPPKELAKRVVGHGDGALFRCFVAVALEDQEVNGLWENYEFHEGEQSGIAKLTQFGLRPIAKNAAIIIRITNPEIKVEINQERSGLYQGGRPFSFAGIAEEFRKNMPRKLVSIIEEEQSTKRGKSDWFNDWASASVSWFDTSGLRKVLRKGAGGTAKMFTVQKPKKNTKAESGTDTLWEKANPSKKKTKGGKGKGLGLTIDIRPEEWTDATEEDKFTFCYYDQYRRTLHYNSGCVSIDEELSKHLARKGAGLAIATDLAEAREVIITWAIRAAIETIINTETRMKLNPEGNWSECLSSEVLTTCSFITLQRRTSLSREINGLFVDKA